jgi:hypothetical protein
MLIILCLWIAVNERRFRRLYAETLALEAEFLEQRRGASAGVHSASPQSHVAAPSFSTWTYEVKPAAADPHTLTGKSGVDRGGNARQRRAARRRELSKLEAA